MPDVLTLTLARVKRETPHACRLVLDLGDAPFRFRAGQAAILGAHGQPRRFPYSIACAPAEVNASRSLEFLVGVDAAGRAGPHLAPLTPGRRIDVEGPVGAFALPASLDDAPLLFIGGGTGIAPLRSMLREVLHRRHRRTITLVQSARTPADFPYLSEFRALAKRGRLRLMLVATRAAGPRWSGARGRIDRSRLEGLARQPDVIAFLCGPPMFASDLAQLLAQAGLPSSRIHTERWA
jgi:ferredoxin-NADP reductase